MTDGPKQRLGTFRLSILKQPQISKIMMKLESTENKVVLEDIQKMKNLIDYGKKTQ